MTGETEQDFDGIDPKHLYDIDEGGNPVEEAATETKPADELATKDEPAKADGSQQQPTADAGTVPDTGTQGNADQTPTPAKQPDTPTPAVVPEASTQQLQDVKDGKLKDDGKGNLIDAQGNIVAQSGGDRRKFESESGRQLFADYQRGQQENARLRQELATARADATVLNGLPQRLNLSNEDVTTGLNLVQQFKSNPVETTKYIIAETLKMGHNLETITGEPGSLEMGTVTRMINDLQTSQQQPQADAARQQEAQQEATRQYNDFMGRYPDARQHENALASIMERDHTLTAEAAYHTLRQYVQTNGLDWNQPLAPQVQVLQQQQQTQPAATVPTPAVTPPAAMPRGTNEEVVVDANDVAPHSDDWSSIIQHSMQKAGMGS